MRLHDPDRVLGCLYGQAVGDALGLPYEGKSREEVRLRGGVGGTLDRIFKDRKVPQPRDSRPEQTGEAMKPEAPIDFYIATAADLASLGFVRWSTDTNLWLCPLAHYNDLPDGIALTSISGDIKVKGRDYIDDGTRGGLLAYGIVPGQTRTTIDAAEVARREEVRRADVRGMLAEAAEKFGVFDLASGRMLYGEEAQASLRALTPRQGDA